MILTLEVKSSEIQFSSNANEILVLKNKSEEKHLSTYALSSLIKNDESANRKIKELTGISADKIIDLLHPKKEITKNDIESIKAATLVDSHLGLLNAKSPERMCKTSNENLILSAAPKSSLSGGFGPDVVGLKGFPITAEYGKVRDDGCRHSGMDIDSGGVPRPYTAGIYGKVVYTGVGREKIIGIVPFSDPTLTVRYLHSPESSYKVSAGDVVAPWTVLADTGNEGRSRGIHVHVDVVAPGPSPYPGCWRNNYINPAKVVRDNTLSGTWYWDGPASQSEVHWQEIHLNMSEGTGSGYRLFKTSVSRRYCDILKSSSYHATLNGNKDATFMFTYQPGKCTINQEGCAGAPRARCIVVDTPGSYPMKLVNENTLEVGNYKF